MIHRSRYLGVIGLLLGSVISLARADAPANGNETGKTAATGKVPFDNYWDSASWEPVSGPSFWNVTDLDVSIDPSKNKGVVDPKSGVAKSPGERIVREVSPVSTK